ncbi:MULTISPECIES: DUF3012 domain-containing protein [Alkalimonas]|uniref:DUF3012 domain-containing protein n=1 Tax=Alkalimonas mucilaginosa TaxID=3057676 RepID=A0ABU7JIN2_9GAMM|nr:DUF3012 domain-containing protein [Alkalimonas sp. MEB004]MEE2025281.1 DUF3012 domain-containing protein [Alkalimonas sp. MEB004]
MKKVLVILMLSSALLALAGCSPAVGSSKWCKAMEAKPQSEWSINDGEAYIEHCFLADD